jgi:hypothetical protein
MLGLGEREEIFCALIESHLAVLYCGKNFYSLHYFEAHSYDFFPTVF